jgi:tetratricopeptide (TPR) repeat protein
MIIKEIEEILGFKLERGQNLITKPTERNDLIIDKLSRISHKRDDLERVKELFKKALEGQSDEMLWSTLGYVHYMLEEFSEAISCFYNTIKCCHINVDNWVDLSFGYRCLGDIETSNFIFWNLSELITEFCNMDNKINEDILRELIDKVRKGNKDKSLSRLIYNRKLSRTKNKRSSLFRR